MLKKIIIASILFSFTHIATADEFLNAEQVKNLFTNKTFDIHNIANDKNLQGFDSEDGKHLVYIPHKDKTSKRKWWLDENKHCTSHPKRGDSCKLIKMVSEGVYHGITDGKHSHTLSNFRDGKSFKK